MCFNVCADIKRIINQIQLSRRDENKSLEATDTVNDQIDVCPHFDEVQVETVFLRTQVQNPVLLLSAGTSVSISAPRLVGLPLFSSIFITYSDADAP